MSSSDASLQSDHAEWIAIGNYRTGLEADLARQCLEADDIPVMSNSDAPGIFGLGFQGVVTGGVTLSVPSPEVERALALLSGDAPTDDDFIGDAPADV